MRLLAIGAILLALVIAVIAQPAMAQPDLSIPFITIGPFCGGPSAPVYALNPNALAALTIIEMNTSRLAAADTEAFAFSFTQPDVSANRLVLSPAIGQTTSQTIVSDRTYFFQDFVSG